VQDALAEQISSDPGKLDPSDVRLEESALEAVQHSLRRWERYHCDGPVPRAVAVALVARRQADCELDPIDPWHPAAEFVSAEVDEVRHDDEQWHRLQPWTEHPFLLSWVAESSAAFSRVVPRDALAKAEAVDCQYS
jgi:hypothetical protein